jgi:hypothetical protein
VSEARTGPPRVGSEIGEVGGFDADLFDSPSDNLDSEFVVLEQVAEPGEILVGQPTYRLVRDAVKVEPVAGAAVRVTEVPWS